MKLAIGSFKTREYGMKPRPSFPIVGWTGDGQNVVTHKEPGPPDTDPDDPGYASRRLSVSRLRGSVVASDGPATFWTI